MTPAQRILTEEIPEHLLPYIIEQNPKLYTDIDHASWRFILKISRLFFSKNAHQKYMDGLQKTGISTERIPLISEMDACLRQFGWRAVAVSGFIPPAAFMEFQSLGILPIACDMRKTEHISYTPAPDIVHEAAGHAPILADPEYAEYLRHYGEVSKKAIYSLEDLAIYHAIRKLSETKEDPLSSGDALLAAQKELDFAIASQKKTSEAALLARMNWWTVEYGLVGTLDSPKIYGAGLLSSVGESYDCLKETVKKIPLSTDCVNYAYDITRPQPQLFVTPSFRELSRVLDEFAETMAFRTGGKIGLKKALEARTVTTAELDSGLQIGGKLIEILFDQQEIPFYLRYEGPCQLAVFDSEISNQGPEQHPHGFGTPLGNIIWQGASRNPSTLKGFELIGLNELLFESGVKIKGSIRSSFREGDTLLILSWENCTVTKGDRKLFEPAWGVFDMACGTQVCSVFGNAPDRGAYLRTTQESPAKIGKPKTNQNEQNQNLNFLYAEVRRIREKGPVQNTLNSLSNIYLTLKKNYPEDWLLRLELLELNQAWSLNSEWKDDIHRELTLLSRQNPITASLIARGLEALA